MTRTRHTDVQATVQEIKALIEYYDYPLNKIAKILKLSPNYVYKLSSLHNIRGKEIEEIKVESKKGLTSCPECGSISLRRDPEMGESVCTKCGIVVDQQPDMVHRLPFDETYAFENPLVFNKSLGTADTLRRNYGLAKVLGKARNSKNKIRLVAEIVKECERGNISLVEAGRDIRNILVNGGAEDIAEEIAEHKKKQPSEVARRIVNKFDAIPVHQITTLSEVYEPLLMRKMKEYGNQVRVEAGLDISNPICDPDIFSVALGNLIEKVCNFALFVEGVKHSPKDLTEACFLRTVQKMKPDVTIEGINPPADALMFVDLVTRILSFGKVKEVKGLD